MIRLLLLVLAIACWLLSSQIAIHIFPPTSEESINNFWDLKKILYSIVILLLIISSKEQTKSIKFVLCIFAGILLEDITDRLIFNTKEFEYNDLIAIELTLVISIYLTFKSNIHDFLYKTIHNKFSNNDRD